MAGKNAKPVQDLMTALRFDSLELKCFDKMEMFSLSGILTTDREKEKVIYMNMDHTETKEQKDIVYIFALNNKILKVGSTGTNLRQRLASYNTGKKKYADSGTCSTTNFFVLQSLLNINEPIAVYTYYPPKMKIDVFGEEQEVSCSKLFEKAILKSLKDSGNMSMFCTQT